MGGPRTAAPPRPQRVTAEYNGSAGTPTRHTSGTDGARTKHVALPHRKYGLLAPIGTAVDPDDAGDLGSKYSHEATGGTAGQDRKETEEGGETRKHALLTSVMRGANDEGRRPTEWLRTLNVCSR